MSTQRWHELQALFAAALEQPIDGRDAFVEQACGADAALASQLRALLAHDEQAEDPVTHLVQEAASRALGDRDARRAWVGRRLGAWRIVEHLADGGMGAVFRAERADGQFEQQVAIKLLNPAFVAGQAADRLAAERRILARLEHPHIARLLDGGTTDDGAPYFVMEYVDGTPIDDYCSTHALDTAARLKLFRQVCGAVDAAHRNLVVHRDLKPANILVDRQGQPKLLDFGIAKLVERADATLTAADQRVLTPTHASPEQIRGEPVTTSTDVYALGVLLYQLLAGRLPFTGDEKTPASAAELARQVLHSEPPPPSAAVMQGRRERIGAARQHDATLTPRRLGRELRGDLDNIVMMALRKEPARRYGSVQALDDDIARFLRNQPVHARSNALRYRIGKFVLRHRVGLVAGAAVLLGAMALVGFYTWQLALERDRAQQAAELARVAAERAEKVAEFLAGVFAVADPTNNLGKTVTARELLDHGAQQIDRELAGDPAVQAALMEAMGDAYRNLGLYPEARDLQQKALDVRLSEFGPDSAEAARSLSRLGQVTEDLGHYDAAIGHLQRALAILRRAQSPDPLAIARALRALANARRENGKDYAEAERTYLAAIDSAARAGKAGDAERARSMTGLGFVLRFSGKLTAARSWLEQALALRIQTFGETHPETIQSISALGALLLRETRHTEAIAQFERALSLARRVYGADHLQTAYIAANLGNALVGAGRYAEAEHMMREALPIFRARLGEDHPRTNYMTENLANAIFYQARYDEALPMYLNSVERIRQRFGESHAEYGLSLSNLCGVYVAMERFNEAIATCRRAAGVLDKAFPPGHFVAVETLTKLGTALIGAGRLGEADSALRLAQEQAQLQLPQDHAARADIFEQQGWLLLARDKPSEAEPLFRAGLKIVAANQPEGGPPVASKQAALGVALTRLRRFEEAESLLLKSYSTLQKSLGDGHKDTRKERTYLADLYRAMGRGDLAARYADRRGSRTSR
ncbi:MAG TPA: serine/threonine-protein kinase [Burkholderiaceae bacterium]|nr:serine/threonine-protein kinase [Burkholderiaceae bacterium]